MTYETYKEKLSELETEFEKKKVDLTKEFVNANHPYKIGDKVTDHIGTIVVEKFGFYRNLCGVPGAIFIGAELNKDGTEKKNGKKRNVYQMNLITS